MGFSQKNNYIKSKDTNPILDAINEENNELHSNKNEANINIILNIITLTLIVIFSFLVFRKVS